VEPLDASSVYHSWVGRLLRPALEALLERSGRPRPTEAELREAFRGFWQRCSATLMVQEPWMGTVRFKRLAHFTPEAFTPMIRDPESYLRERFGGGKFKVNFYQGMSFLATRNFKPEGDPIWRAMPEVQDD
jgi:hypothetical protein